MKAVRRFALLFYWRTMQRDVPEPVTPQWLSSALEVEGIEKKDLPISVPKGVQPLLRSWRKLMHHRRFQLACEHFLGPQQAKHKPLKQVNNPMARGNALLGTAEWLMQRYEDQLDQLPLVDLMSLNLAVREARRASNEQYTRKKADTWAVLVSQGWRLCRRSRHVHLWNNVTSSTALYAKPSPSAQKRLRSEDCPWHSAR